MTTRNEALDYLTNTYAEIAAEAQFSESARLFTYGLAIDQSLRALGFDEGELGSALVDEEVREYLALLDYYALTRFLTAFSVRTDVTLAGGISTSQSQAFEQVKQLVERAEARLSALNINPVEAMTLGRMTLDIYEPDVYWE